MKHTLDNNQEVLYPNKEEMTGENDRFNFFESILNSHKQNKINEISQACKNEIISGFKSTAKTIEYTYESDEIDQLNLIGAVTTGVRQNVKCSLDNGKTWKWLDHLNSEIKQVLKDGAATKSSYLERAALLKNQISTASLEQLDQIKW